MMQSPKVCGVFYAAPYCAISLSIVLLLLNMILFDISPMFSDYQYISKIKKRYPSAKPSLDPLDNMVGVDQIQGTVSEFSDKTMISSLQLMSLKIYVYNLPARFNNDLLKSRPSYSSKYDYDETGCRTEAAIHNFLLTSNHRAHGPTKADFFYVPVYGLCYHQSNIHTDNNPLKLYQEALAYIKSHHPYFNMSYGRDHVWSISSYALKKASHHLWQIETKNSIMLYYGVQSIKALEYVPHKDLVIPPNLSRYNFTPCYELSLQARPKHRYVVHMASSSFGLYLPNRVHTNSSKKMYYFRQLLLSTKVKISSVKSKSVIHDMMSSIFCLCLPGSHSWSEMFYLSILSGCIPVLFGTDIEIAFQGIVDPSRFTVQVRLQDIDQLKEILLSISHEHVTSMQNEMERIWKLFYYGSSGMAKEVIIKSLVKRKCDKHVHYHYYSTAKFP
ncbi:uncharacterized protein [Dysidea avara]|uniref:uncharacterized protein n=1 Tax=Dysidea avara TaxID=196820 RepID=UPI0033277A98